MTQIKKSEMTKILGGKHILQKEIATDIDLISLSEQGVPKAALEKLTQYLGFSLMKMASLLSLSERTLQRYDAKTRFNRLVSEHILHIAEVTAKGVDVFENKKLFLKWLQHPSIALNNTAPGDLLKSRFGINMVLQELGRLEHGIVS